jgi:hypothetical protein
MRVGLLVIELFLHGASSLKEKRRVVRGLRDRCRSRYNVAVAEVDHQDLHQRATLAFTSVGTEELALGQLFDRLLDEAENAAPGGVSEISREFL